MKTIPVTVEEDWCMMSPARLKSSSHYQAWLAWSERRRTTALT